jgi:diaminopropionate ammonia-lyase
VLGASWAVHQLLAVAGLTAAGISAGPSGAASLAGARAALTGPGSAQRRDVLVPRPDPVIVLLSTEAAQIVTEH